MKKFDKKWLELVARARSGSPTPVTIPFGFAERVLCGGSPPESDAVSGDRLWLRFGLRTLATMSAVLIVFATVHWSSVTGTQLLRPPIEHSIIDYSGLL